MNLAPALMDQLRQSLGVSSLTFSSVGGGSINQAGRLTTSKGSFFCKINSATKFPQLFRREAEGLNRLASPGLIKVPDVIGCWEDDHHQVLVLEWIEPGERTEVFWKSFGSSLARLHQCTSDHFGLEENNYMGSVSQDNTPTKSWITFFTKQRLQPLARHCLRHQLLSPRHVTQLEKLGERLPSLFEPEPPSLLHGDLWSGNFMCNQDSEPVLIDPAVYYGHRSMDLGMTALFGGFRQPFYEAYHYHYPLPGNYEEQWEVSNLYPLLIHLILFGKSYLGGIEETLRKYA